MRLQPVTGALPAGFEALRDEARRAGHRMLDTLEREWACGATRFDRPGEALLAAYVGDVLVGIGGLTVEPAIQHSFRMRRFYVRAQFRRAGIARRLADSLLRGRGAENGAITANAAAGSEAFWQALGFVADRRDGYTHILVRSSIARKPRGGADPPQYRSTRST